MKARLCFRSRIVLLNGVILLAAILIACSSGPASSAGKFNPKKGELEQTAQGRTLAVGWEMGEGDLEVCRITLLEKGTSTGEMVMLFEPCTPDNVRETLEGWKEKLPGSSPGWMGAALDQLISALRQLE